MTVHNIDDFTNGWLIGDFEPSILNTKSFELGVHKCKAGLRGVDHFHKLSTEYNVVITGKIIANGKELGPGSVFVFEPCEISSCEFLEDTILVVARNSSNPQDKILV